MNKLFKSGIFGIACAMTMMNVAYVKADPTAQEKVNSNEKLLNVETKITSIEDLKTNEKPVDLIQCKNYQLKWNSNHNWYDIVNMKPDDNGVIKIDVPKKKLKHYLIVIPMHAVDRNCCDNVKEIKIGEGVHSIVSHAFDNCTNLRSVKLPSTIAHVDPNAFYKNEKLRIHVHNMIGHVRIPLRIFDELRKEYGDAVRDIISGAEKY